jgi:hypothetical protein
MASFLLVPSLILTLFGILLLGGCQTTPEPAQDSPRSTLDARSAVRLASQLEYFNPELTAALGMGDSMAPLYGENTVVLIGPIDFDDLGKGMNVAYRNNRQQIVIHQLMRKDGPAWVAKGINNPNEDREKVTRANILGVVYTVIYSEGLNL